MAPVFKGRIPDHVAHRSDYGMAPPARLLERKPDIERAPYLTLRDVFSVHVDVVFHALASPLGNMG